VVVGPDSGPTHMAWAINKPSITIYGPTPFWRNSYETKINLTIDSKEEIDPKKLDKNSDCISKINPKDIANLTKRLLNG
jgi:heptosyltransferase-1